LEPINHQLRLSKKSENLEEGDAVGRNGVNRSVSTNGSSRGLTNLWEAPGEEERGACWVKKLRKMGSEMESLEHGPPDPTGARAGKKKWYLFIHQKRECG